MNWSSLSPSSSPITCMLKYSNIWTQNIQHKIFTQIKVWWEKTLAQSLEKTNLRDIMCIPNYTHIYNTKQYRSGCLKINLQNNSCKFYIMWISSSSHYNNKEILNTAHLYLSYNLKVLNRIFFLSLQIILCKIHIKSLSFIQQITCLTILQQAGMVFLCSRHANIWLHSLVAH